MNLQIPTRFGSFVLALASLIVQPAAEAGEKNDAAARAKADQQWKLEQTQRNQANQNKKRPAPQRVGGSWSGSRGGAGVVTVPQRDALTFASVTLGNFSGGAGPGGSATIKLVGGRQTYTLNGTWSPANADFTVNLSLNGASGTLTMVGTSLATIRLSGPGFSGRFQ